MQVMPPGADLIEEEIQEDVVVIDGQKIGYCRFGTGPHKLIFIPGGVGEYGNRGEYISSRFNHPAEIFVDPAELAFFAKIK